MLLARGDLRNGRAVCRLLGRCVIANCEGDFVPGFWGKAWERRRRCGGLAGNRFVLFALSSLAFTCEVGFAPSKLLEDTMLFHAPTPLRVARSWGLAEDFPLLL
jgi:hypothetical protein